MLQSNLVSRSSAIQEQAPVEICPIELAEYLEQNIGDVGNDAVLIGLSDAALCARALRAMAKRSVAT